MVQTESQYICIYQCLLTVLEGRENTSPLREIHDNQGYEGKLEEPLYTDLYSELYPNLYTDLYTDLYTEPLYTSSRLSRKRQKLLLNGNELKKRRKE